jgi:DNA replication protein DnaC
VKDLLPKQIQDVATKLRLPTIARQAIPIFTRAGHQEALPTFLEALTMECDERKGRRVERLRISSRLPEGKTFSNLNTKRLPRLLVQSLETLTSGAFVRDATNVLAFGLPGVGKTHAVAALGHALIDIGIPVYFTPTFRLVQELLEAKREYELPRALRRLERFEVLILDDIGYVQQTQEEMEVLFTLLAERYERASTVITSNLVFSQWEQIFKNPLTTAAAIDRVVHHSVILEFNVTSYRNEEAEMRVNTTA